MCARPAATLRHHHAAAPAAEPQQLVSGGLRPHLYCLPVLKREHHREALLKVATSGNPRFFLGTDTARTPGT